MGYRIGSFNCLNLGFNFQIEKNIDALVNLIQEEELDIIALQEIKRGNEIDRLLRRLGSKWSGCHDSYGNFSSPNDYAYIWNNTKVKECSKDKRPEVYSLIKANDFFRKPYYGRFIPADSIGGIFIELRLLDVHLYYGDGGMEATQKRKDEFKILTNEVYTRVNKKRYGNNRASYTILLGDYNMTSKWCEQENVENQNIVTFQDELTTLKSSEDGFSKDYDHFSYDTVSFSGINTKVSRINSVDKYFGGDFEKHRKTFSDHVPILIKIDFK